MMPVRVCLGGTFNVVHAGHLALLRRAIELGDEIYIGLTSDAMASRNRKVQVRDYDTRLKNLTRTLDGIAGSKRYFLFPLDDPVGPAGRENYDIIVVSRETEKGARRINEVRRRAGLRPLRIEIVDMVLAGDGTPVSSSRIIRGEISPGAGGS